MTRVVADREPGVAVADGAAQRRRALAADPDRRVRLLHRLGQKADVAETTWRPAKRGSSSVHSSLKACSHSSVTRPRSSNGGAPTASNSSFIQPAPTPSDHAPAREHVDRGRDLGGVHRAAIGDHRDRGDQARLAADRRQIGEQGELLEALARSRAGPGAGGGVRVARADAARHHHVVGDREMGKAELLGAAHERRDRVRRGERAAGWEWSVRRPWWYLPRAGSDGEAPC